VFFLPMPYVYETLFCRLKFFVVQFIKKFTIFMERRVKVEENFGIFWKINLCLKVHIKVDFFRCPMFMEHPVYSAMKHWWITRLFAMLFAFRTRAQMRCCFITAVHTCTCILVYTCILVQNCFTVFCAHFVAMIWGGLWSPCVQGSGKKWRAFSWLKDSCFCTQSKRCSSLDLHSTFRRSSYIDPILTPLDAATKTFPFRSIYKLLNYIWLSTHC
jgi:hypothetical protein